MVEPGNSFRGGGTESVGDSDNPSIFPATAKTTTVFPCFRAWLRLQKHLRKEKESLKDISFRNYALHSRPARFLKVVTGDSLRAVLEAAATMAAARGCSELASKLAANCKTLPADNISNDWLPFCKSAGFIKNYVANFISDL